MVNKVAMINWLLFLLRQRIHAHNVRGYFYAERMWMILGVSLGVFEIIECGNSILIQFVIA